MSVTNQPLRSQVTEQARLPILSGVVYTPFIDKDVEGGL
jgi:hypothetical protein